MTPTTTVLWYVAWFIIGVWVGAVCGVAVMALAHASRDETLGKRIELAKVERGRP